MIDIETNPSATDILNGLQTSSVSSGRQGAVINLELPSERVFKYLDPEESSSSLRRRVTYKLSNPSQCLQQASTLLSVLAEPLDCETPMASLAEHGPWLLDSLHALCNAQTRWDPPIDVAIVPLIRIALSLASRRITNGSTRSIIHTKACIVLSFLLTELATKPAELLGDSEAAKSCRDSLCESIVSLAKVSISNRPVGRLVSAHVVGHCEYLSLQVSELGTGTDFAVSLCCYTKSRHAPVADSYCRERLFSSGRHRLPKFRKPLTQSPIPNISSLRGYAVRWRVCSWSTSRRMNLQTNRPRSGERLRRADRPV